MAYKKSNSGGGKSLIGKAFSFLLALGLIGIFFQIPSSPDAKTFYEGLKSRSEVLAAWAANLGNSIGTGTIDLGIELRTPEPIDIEINPELLEGGNADFNQLFESFNKIGGSYSESVDYNRDEWIHWDNYERSCWTVREEVLWRDAVKDESLTLLDNNKVRTNDKSKACEITGGTWVDPYTGETFTNPQDLDIDHMIALGYAARAGGQEWSLEKKRDYANSLDYSKHLLAVSASANRSKSDKGPSEWLPANEAYHCQYGIAWMSIASEWKLTLSEADKTKVVELIQKCA